MFVTFTMDPLDVLEHTVNQLNIADDQHAQSLHLSTVLAAESRTQFHADVEQVLLHTASQRVRTEEVSQRIRQRCPALGRPVQMTDAMRQLLASRGLALPGAPAGAAEPSVAAPPDDLMREPQYEAIGFNIVDMASDDATGKEIDCFGLLDGARCTVKTRTNKVLCDRCRQQHNRHVQDTCSTCQNLKSKWVRLGCSPGCRALICPECVTGVLDAQGVDSSCPYCRTHLFGRDTRNNNRNVHLQELRGALVRQAQG